MSALANEARALLKAPGCHGNPYRARRAHAGAVATGDREAIALWARVLWRYLRADPQYQWMTAWPCS